MPAGLEAPEGEAKAALKGSKDREERQQNVTKPLFFLCAKQAGVTEGRVGQVVMVVLVASAAPEAAAAT